MTPEHDQVSLLVHLASMFEPSGSDLHAEARRIVDDLDHETSDAGLRVLLDLFPDSFERMSTSAPSPVH